MRRSFDSFTIARARLLAMLAEAVGSGTDDELRRIVGDRLPREIAEAFHLIDCHAAEAKVARVFGVPCCQ